MRNVTSRQRRRRVGRSPSARMGTASCAQLPGSGPPDSSRPASPGVAACAYSPQGSLGVASSTMPHAEAPIRMRAAAGACHCLRSRQRVKPHSIQPDGCLTVPQGACSGSGCGVRHRLHAGGEHLAAALRDTAVDAAEHLDEGRRRSRNAAGAVGHAGLLDGCALGRPRLTQCGAGGEAPRACDQSCLNTETAGVRSPQAEVRWHRHGA